MNFKDALMTCELVFESGAVPLLIGESGIGKTALVKKLSQLKEAHLIGVDANLLKEGEIGGLPTTETYNITVNQRRIRRKKTVYAIHTKLLEIDQVLIENPKKKIILFIDEINRCEHAVQQELMNIILNREINGFILPDNVLVIAAMNPSNKYDHYSESTYQVVDMDPAQEDRFVWIEMDSDSKSWIDWGLSREGKNYDSRSFQNIHEDVLEFISSFPEHLHAPYSQETVKATPRSWERISDSYIRYLDKKAHYPQGIFFNVVKGNVGSSAAHDFFNFLENNRNPIIKPEEIFRYKKIPEALKARVKKDTHSRLYLTARNCLNTLAEAREESPEEVKDKVALFTEFLQLYPGDLKMGIMQEIKANFEKTLYKDFMNVKSFIDGYIELYQEVKMRSIC